MRRALDRFPEPQIGFAHAPPSENARSFPGKSDDMTITTTTTTTTILLVPVDHEATTPGLPEQDRAQKSNSRDGQRRAACLFFSSSRTARADKAWDDRWFAVEGRCALLLASLPFRLVGGGMGLTSGCPRFPGSSQAGLCHFSFCSACKHLKVGVLQVHVPLAPRQVRFDRSAKSF